MRQQELRQLDRELRAYLEAMFAGVGRTERRRALAWYVTGLLLEGARKSIQPMAARLVDEAAEIEAMRQRLQQAITGSAWADEAVRRRVARHLDRELPGVEGLIVDDTGVPKKGTHSVGVARQYSGTLGRTDNCQVVVSLHVAGEAGSGGIAMRLYLPEAWAGDRARRRQAGVPDDIPFLRTWEIALAQLDEARAWGVRRHVVLADSAYGDVTEFREALIQRRWPYVVQVEGTLVVWPPGRGPRPPAARRPGRRGRPLTRFRDGRQRPESIVTLARHLPPGRYRTVTWREGSRGPQASRFATVRVRTAHRHTEGHPPSPAQWLLIEWPDGEAAPTTFWLSTLSSTTARRRLVRLAKLRWRIERDYQDLKEELGLDHFEGRTWRGFHHHATLCLLAHGFLTLRRARFSPSARTVDAPAGPPTASTGTAALDRRLSAVPTAHRRRFVPSWPVTHVTK